MKGASIFDNDNGARAFWPRKSLEAVLEAKEKSRVFDLYRLLFDMR